MFEGVLDSCRVLQCMKGVVLRHISDMHIRHVYQKIVIRYVYKKVFQTVEGCCSVWKVYETGL